MLIRPYQISDESSVIALWQECRLTRPWNSPKQDIARKLTTQPELFLVGIDETGVVATAMIGYDGNRGWVHYLGVLPSRRTLSYGKAVMQEAERILVERGCPKLNIQVRSSNTAVISFYEKLGYQIDEVVSLGKRLIPD
jgi:ribosomal protein S18 acetylase RimI-like enzyme